MVLEFGNTSQLAGKPYYMLELRNEKTLEPTLRRIIRSIPHMFRDEAFEMFIPIQDRDLDVFTLSTGPYVFVRSTSFPSLLRLKTITGVVSLVTEGETNRPTAVIPIDEAYVQQLIQQARDKFEKQPASVKEGCFVRILDGETRDYCGFVEVIHEGIALVRVELKTKSMLIETPVQNLMDLSGVSTEYQVFYFSPLLADLSSEVFAEDKKSDDNWAATGAKETDTHPLVYTRQRTVTALVKRLVLVEDMRNPLEIGQKVLEAIKRKEIRPPRNLFIIYSIIKDTIRDYYHSKDPEITNYWQVIKKMGKQYKFRPEDIAKIVEIDIPLYTDGQCNDGRSKEARQRKLKGLTHDEKDNVIA